MKNRLKVTIAVAAYNAEENIGSMLSALVKQIPTADFVIQKIIVFSDAGSDNTVEKAKVIKDRRIYIINARKRKGFASVVKELIHMNSSDVLILLNDDISITDSKFIQKVISPFIKEKNVGLVSGNPQPIQSNELNFIQKAVISGFRIYENTRYVTKNGENIYTCDGKVLALSKEFCNKVVFPSNQAFAGNVDSFLYLLCLTKGYKYKHAKSAKVYFKCPDNLSDYIRWSTRNKGEYYLLKKYFGTSIRKEFIVPPNFFYYSFFEIVRNPLGCIFLICTGIYIRFKAKTAEKWFTSTWKTVLSTKGVVKAS